MEPEKPYVLPDMYKSMDMEAWYEKWRAKPEDIPNGNDVLTEYVSWEQSTQEKLHGMYPEVSPELQKMIAGKFTAKDALEYLRRINS
jgi:hypothetical protein